MFSFSLTRELASQLVCGAPCDDVQLPNETSLIKAIPYLKDILRLSKALWDVQQSTDILLVDSCCAGRFHRRRAAAGTQVSLKS